MAKTKFQAKLKDAYYFPHFCNARHDRKIKRVRKELAVEGYGIYFMILEILREQADFRYPIEDIDLIADELQTSEQKVNAVIYNYDLFKFDTDEMFYSENLIIFLQPYLIKSQNAKKAAQVRWSNHEKTNGFSHENTSKHQKPDAFALPAHNKCNANVDTNAMPEEIITNEIREEEIIKEKNTKKENYYSCENLSYFFDDDFQEAWSAWMNVRKKKKAVNSERAMNIIYGKLKDISKEIAIQMLDKSIVGSWSDIYESSKSFKPFNPEKIDKFQGEANFEL